MLFQILVGPKEFYLKTEQNQKNEIVEWSNNIMWSGHSVMKVQIFPFPLFLKGDYGFLEAWLPGEGMRHSKKIK